MEITISISDRTAEIIQHKAEETGKNVSRVVEEVLEEKFPDDKKHESANGEDVGEPRERKHNLLKFAGMFSGGDGKTAENYKKILREEIDSVAGFTTDKTK